MKLKVGLLLDKIEYNQYVHYASKFIERNPKADLIGFFDNPFSTGHRLNFALMQITELYSFDGVGIACNISTAEKLIASPSPKLKLLYLWDLEWLRHPQIYHNYARIYRNKELKIIARCEDRAGLFKNAFNRKVNHIADNFKFDTWLNTTYTRLFLKRN